MTMESKYAQGFKSKPNGRLRDILDDQKNAQRQNRKNTRGKLMLAGRQLSPASPAFAAAVHHPIENVMQPCGPTETLYSSRPKNKMTLSTPQKQTPAAKKQKTAAIAIDNQQKILEKERLQKMKEWRREKEIQQKKVKKLAKRKPFITTVPVGRYVERDDAKKSFAPCDHTFKRPVTVRLPKIVVEKVTRVTRARVAAHGKISPVKPQKVKIPPVKIPPIKVKPVEVVEPKVKATKKVDKKQGVKMPIRNNELLFPTVTDKKKKAHYIFNPTDPVTSTVRKQKSNAGPCLITDDEDLSPIENEEPPSAKKKRKISSKTSTPATDKKTPSRKRSGDNLNNSSYLSPNVSVTRGKTSARKESMRRQTIYKVAQNAQLESQRVIQHYRGQLAEQTTRLNEMCASWNKYMSDNPTLEEDHRDLINIAVGQTKLLMTRRFSSFGELIELCVDSVEAYEGDGKAVLPTDLEGLWTNIFAQIANCELRFQKLDTLKANNWVEEQPAETTLPPRQAKLKANRKVQRMTTRVSKHMRDIISQARAKRNAQMEQENVPMSPTVEILDTKPRKSRSTMHAETPAKSILKTPGSRMSIKKVMFHNKSNDSSPMGASKVDGERRSRRLSLKDISNV